jgi:hypothetical protein
MRTEQQMDVVCHEHVRMNSAVEFLRALAQPMQVKAVVLLGKEARRPVIASLDDM